MKDNKLIAEFMGYNYDKCIASTDKSVTLQEQGEYFIPKYNSGDWISESELEFHESWDWLMPVIIKIEGGGLDPHELIDKALESRVIEDTYNEVVDAIKRCNSERSKWDEQTRIEEGLDHKG